MSLFLPGAGVVTCWCRLERLLGGGLRLHCGGLGLWSCFYAIMTTTPWAGPAVFECTLPHTRRYWGMVMLLPRPWMRHAEFVRLAGLSEGGEGGERKGGEAWVSARVQGARQPRGACECVVVCLRVMVLAWGWHKACRSDSQKSASLYSARGGEEGRPGRSAPLCRVWEAKGVV